MKLLRWLLVALVLAPGPVLATVADGRTLEYRVLRNGSEIGRHKVLFRHLDDGIMTVETEIRITVTLLFITLYTYNLDSTETWRDGRLIALDSATDDNGDLYEVHAAGDGDAMVIDGVDGSWTAPAGTMPSSLWRRAMAAGSLLFGVEQGEPMAVTITAAGSEIISAACTELATEKVVVAGELEREMWYDGDGLLAQLRLTASDFSTILYERVAEHGADDVNRTEDTDECAIKKPLFSSPKQPSGRR